MGLEPVTDYQHGYLDALWAFAHWKDGVAYVGSTGMTHAEAKERFLLDGRREPVRVEPQEDD